MLGVCRVEFRVFQHLSSNLSMLCQLHIFSKKQLTGGWGEGVTHVFSLSLQSFIVIMMHDRIRMFGLTKAGPAFICCISFRKSEGMNASPQPSSVHKSPSKEACPRVGFNPMPAFVGPFLFITPS